MVPGKLKKKKKKTPLSSVNLETQTLKLSYKVHTSKEKFK